MTVINEPKKKLLAITHTVIGECIAKSYGNLPIEVDDRVVIPISGELLSYDLDLRWGDLANRNARIQLVRDQKLVEQMPDILLLYIGKAPMKESLEFAAMFVDAEIHLVFSTDTSDKEYETLSKEIELPQPVTIHRAGDVSGKVMADLVKNFLQYGSLK